MGTLALNFPVTETKGHELTWDSICILLLQRNKYFSTLCLEKLAQPCVGPVQCFWIDKVVLVCNLKNVGGSNCSNQFFTVAETLCAQNEWFLNLKMDHERAPPSGGEPMLYDGSSTNVYLHPRKEWQISTWAFSSWDFFRRFFQLCNSFILCQLTVKRGKYFSWFLDFKLVWLFILKNYISLLVIKFDFLVQNTLICYPRRT